MKKVDNNHTTRDAPIPIPIPKIVGIEIAIDWNWLELVGIG